MKVIFFGMACPDAMLDTYEKKYAKQKMKFVQQRWDYSLSQAFYKLIKDDFQAVSFPPITTFPAGKCLFHRKKRCEDRGVPYTFLSTINLPVLKQLSYCFSALVTLLRFCIRYRGEDKVIVTHCIYPQSALPSFLVRRLARVKVYTIVPDLPEHAVPYLFENHRLLKRLFKSFIHLSEKLKDKFDGYICFSPYQREHLPKDRPYMLMKGFIDTQIMDRVPPADLGTGDRIVVYAGGLHKAYGIDLLVDAFEQAELTGTQLWLFGQGDCVSYIQQKGNPSIIYKGVVDRETMIGIEKSATLLVNPRPTTEEFSKCSFPSKLMEYMASGTPVLTSRLLCIGEEYFDKMYFFNDVSVQGLRQGLIDTLAASDLKKRAASAAGYIREKKTALYQAQRILKFIS